MLTSSKYYSNNVISLPRTRRGELLGDRTGPGGLTSGPLRRILAMVYGFAHYSSYKANEGTLHSGRGRRV